MNIRQFSVGETVQTFLLIKRIESRLTGAGKRYLDIVLCDKSGEISARLWDASMEDEEAYKPNMIVKVRAAVREWNGQPQLSIEKIRPATEADGCRIEDFVPSAPLEPAEMYGEIAAYAGRIRHPDIRAIVCRMLELYKDKLMYYPAAQKNHHAIRAGWLYHVLTMLRSGEKMCEVYDFLNPDLVIAGVILHDIAKLEEMNADELGIVSDYTVEGQLLGHIVQGVVLVGRVGTELGADPEAVLVLQHLIASHHDKGEWGSPKSPMLPEAELLHHLDMIDARMFDMKKALDAVRPGEMTDKVPTLGRRLYRTCLEAGGGQRPRFGNGDCSTDNVEH